MNKPSMMKLRQDDSVWPLDFIISKKFDLFINSIPGLSGFKATASVNMLLHDPQQETEHLLYKADKAMNHDKNNQDNDFDFE